MMKKLSAAMFLFLFLSIFPAWGRSVNYLQPVVDGIPVKMICINLNDPRVKITPMLAKRPYQGETFKKMVTRLMPTAAINGTYFCVSSFRPVGAINIDGRRRYRNTIGTAFAVTWNNQVRFYDYPWVDKVDHRDFEMVISAGPRLLRDGVRALNPRREGFRDRRIFSPATRSAIGVTEGNKVLLVTVHRPIYLGRLAYIMRELGCIDAMALDGGSSIGMFYRGKFISHPRRRMSNILAVYEKSWRIATPASEPPLPWNNDFADALQIGSRVKPGGEPSPRSNDFADALEGLKKEFLSH
ncbi:MAG: phosphodiester glycosidase family protein [bacterium]